MPRTFSFLTPWLFVLILAACSGSQIPANARKTVVSLDKIDCSDCGDGIVADMRTKPGIYEAQFDRKKAEIVIVASPSIDVFTEVRKLAAEDGFEAILGEGKGRYIDHLPFPEGSDVLTVVTDAKDVPDISPHLAQGKVTVVDFPRHGAVRAEKSMNTWSRSLEHVRIWRIAGLILAIGIRPLLAIT